MTRTTAGQQPKLSQKQAEVRSMEAQRFSVCLINLTRYFSLNAFGGNYQLIFWLYHCTVPSQRISAYHIWQSRWDETTRKTEEDRNSQQEGLEWEEKVCVDKGGNVDETVPDNTVDDAGPYLGKQAIPHPWPHLGELFEVVGFKNSTFYICTLSICLCLYFLTSTWAKMLNQTS